MEYPAPLVAYFERTLLDYPWSDEDIPSLVHEDRDGQIVGFLGSYVRRIRLDGRPMRLACSGQLVAAPEPRHRGVGALLVRRYLRGTQDVTITDGATDYMRRIWTGLGGHTDNSASIGWAKFLRPASVGAFLMEYAGHRRLSRSLAHLGSGLDAAARRVVGRRPGFIPPKPATTAEVLTANELVDQMQQAARPLRLRPDYDIAFLDWLFTELDAVTFRGTPVRHLVRDERGRAIGWYVYYLDPGGIAQVLQVAAPAGDAGAVLDHLFAHADNHGAAAVLGRVEAPIIGELRHRRCVFVPTDWRLVHSRDQSVLAQFGTPAAFLSRLDGEWWMGHHSLWLSADAIMTRRKAAAS